MDVELLTRAQRELQQYIREVRLREEGASRINKLKAATSVARGLDYILSQEYKIRREKRLNQVRATVSKLSERGRSNVQ